MYGLVQKTIATTQQLLLSSDTPIQCKCEQHSTHTNTLLGRNVEIWNVTWGAARRGKQPCKINLRMRLSRDDTLPERVDKQRVGSVSKRNCFAVTDLTDAIDCRHVTTTCTLLDTSVRPFEWRYDEETSFNIQNVSEHQ
jgi:hypothetical protein